MATLAGIFFSFISIFGLVKCQTKTVIRKIVLVAFSLFLILGQLLFINSLLQVGGDQFLAFSGLLSGVILILAFQKRVPE
jgi:1,4-dihydroxy-2-naphthoate octaprenyltransferase